VALVSNQAVLCRYGSGRTTGVGFAIAPAITRVDVGGRGVTSYLRLLLRRGGHNFDTSAGVDTVRRIKECVGEISQHSLADGRAVVCKSFVLPDGNILDAGAERLQAPELLFDPSLIGVEGYGVHQCLYQAIHKCDLELRDSQDPPAPNRLSLRLTPPPR